VGHRWNHIVQSADAVAARRKAIDEGVVGGVGPARAAGGQRAQAVTRPVPPDDLEMDLEYLVDGRPMTFAGSSKGVYYFNEGSERRRFDAAALSGKVAQALPA
jgi:hypothetical protein